MKYKIWMLVIFFGVVIQTYASQITPQEICTLNRVCFNGCKTLADCNKRVKESQNKACFAVEFSGHTDFVMQIDYMHKGHRSSWVKKATKEEVLQKLKAGLSHTKTRIVVFPS